MFSLIKDTLSRLFLLSLDAMRKTTITTPSTNKTNLNNQHDWKAQKVAMLHRTHYKRIPFSFVDFFSQFQPNTKSFAATWMVAWHCTTLPLCQQTLSSPMKCAASYFNPVVHCLPNPETTVSIYLSLLGFARAGIHDAPSRKSTPRNYNMKSGTHKKKETEQSLRTPPPCCSTACTTRDSLGRVKHWCTETGW